MLDDKETRFFWDFLKFLERNSSSIEFLTAMVVVGLALYVILRLIDKFD